MTSLRIYKLTREQAHHLAMFGLTQGPIINKRKDLFLECRLFTAVCCQCVSENYLYRGYKHACSVCTSIEVALTFNILQIERSAGQVNSQAYKLTKAQQLPKTLAPQFTNTSGKNLNYYLLFYNITLNSALF